MVVGFVSEDGSMTRDDIADYRRHEPDRSASAASPASAACRCSARSYAMRIWLDPDKLNTYQLSTEDVIAAIRAQNQQVSVGQLGGTPAVPGQQLNATIRRAGPAADARAVPRHRRAQPTPTAPC